MFSPSRKTKKKTVIKRRNIIIRIHSPRSCKGSSRFVLRLQNYPPGILTSSARFGENDENCSLQPIQPMLRC